MNLLRTRFLGGLAAGLLLAGAAEPQAESVLSNSEGKPARLSDFRGKPVVLFYETRDSTTLNKDFKDLLFKRAKERGLLQAAGVVAVANIGEFDFFPARNFALSAVRDSEKKFGIPILVDWSGELSKPPLSLPSRTASVVVLDREGRLVLKRTGKLKEKEQEEVLGAVEGLLK